METSILQTLSFDINIPVSYRFLRRYAKVCVRVCVTSPPLLPSVCVCVTSPPLPSVCVCVCVPLQVHVALSPWQWSPRERQSVSGCTAVIASSLTGSKSTRSLQK